VDSAVEAFRGGAVDYLTKPIDLRRLAKIIENVRRALELREEIDELRGELRRLGRFGRIVGASEIMQRVYDMVERVAPTDSTVLIVGETGTGRTSWPRPFTSSAGAPRSRFCRSTAEPSRRADRVGAVRPRARQLHGRRPHAKGIFERADGGTLFSTRSPRCRSSCR
jgi:DNA-binding NtrC family response regulator